MFPVDNVTLRFRGVSSGEELPLPTGGTEALPGVVFTVVLTPINDADAPPPGRNRAQRSSVNGLYSLHIDMLDGIDGGTNGVMVLHEGRIRGGDAYFDYIGAYTAAERPLEGRTGQPRAHADLGERPLFGGKEVGIGFVRHLR